MPRQAHPSQVYDPRWAAVQARDPAADLLFVYAVKTTGIYCRPSSRSRLPRRENVEFFDTPAAAEAAGYRPSKRTSDQSMQHTQRIAAACRKIENVEKSPTLRALAAEAQLSPYHFHRLFKAITGVTPKEYANAQRAKKVRDFINKSNCITEAIYAAGFDSNSNFYATSNKVLGMKPTIYRAGGTDTNMYFAIGTCSLGVILVAQSARGVCAIALGEDPAVLLRDLQDKFPYANLIGADSKFEQVIAQVIGFIETPTLGLNLPLDIRGTAFQQRVWQALCEIPLGCTVSYTEIAQRIGAPTAVRAVAQACGANPLALAIPCHRVIRRDGNQAGYRWGIERKRILLEREDMASKQSPAICSSVLRKNTQKENPE